MALMYKIIISEPLEKIKKYLRKIKMEKIIKWIHEHRKITIFLIGMCILAPILVIHFLFKVHSNCYWIEAEWKAGDILGYFGDVISFVGTIILGYIAIAQTEKSNQMNKELLEIEKNRIKPCVDITATELSNIYLGEAMRKKLQEVHEKNNPILELTFTKKPRTGITTSILLLQIPIYNSGSSDISRIFVKKVHTSYLAVLDPNNKGNEIIPMLMDKISLKSGEKTDLYICYKFEISNVGEIDQEWYYEHAESVLPHLEMQLVLEIVGGKRYIEDICCGSSWNSSMENTREKMTRLIGSTLINVKEICD